MYVATWLSIQNRKESHSLLHYYVDILKHQGFNAKAIALRGDPRDELVRKVKELHADTLILGCRGLGMVKRALLGSLSDYCVHHCECPVVVVKHPKPDSLPKYGKHYITAESKGVTTTSAEPVIKKPAKPNAPAQVSLPEQNVETPLGETSYPHVPPSAILH